MTLRLRIAALVALVAAAFGAAGGARAAPAPCERATDGTYLATDLAVAQRIAANERSGGAVARARSTIEHDGVLASAAARGDLTAVHRELLVLLYNHEHIVRIRVSRGARLLADIGGPEVLAPVAGQLRAGGRSVGTFLFSIQDDLGYQLLAQRLVGADTVIGYEGRTLLANIDTASARLPARGAVRIAGRDYLVATISTGRFPTGTLAIALLVARPSAALAREPCPAVRADALGAIARRVYEEAIHGPAAGIARAAIGASAALPSAIDAKSSSSVAFAARALIATAHASRLQVLVGRRVIADVGSRAALLAPISVAVADGSGRQIATVLLSIQSVGGFDEVASSLTAADVLVREGDRQLAGRRRGPATLPAHGPLDYAGAPFEVSSFAGALFPRGALTVYVLVRG